MLDHAQARERVLSQLAYEFHAHNSSELIQGETERDWGWLFLYEAFSGGHSCGWIVNRNTGEMMHLPAIASVEEALEEYERTIGR
jgi:hypothetical protein